jgi:WD40 repeat protein
VSVEVADDYADQVEVCLTGNGRKVTINKGDDWKATLSLGQYAVSLSKGDDRFVLDHQTLTVMRGEESKITVRFIAQGSSDAAVDDDTSSDADWPVPQVATVPRTPLPDGPPGVLHTIDLPGRTDTPIELSPNGRTVAIAAGRYGFNLIDLSSRDVVRSFGTDAHANQVAFTPDGELLLAAYASHSGVFVRAYDLRSEGTLEVASYRDWEDLGSSNPRLAVAPVGTLAAVSAAHSSSVHVFDWQTGRRVRTLELGGTFAGSGGELSFSPDAEHLLGGGMTADGRSLVQLWDVETGEARRRITPNYGGVLALRFGQDARHFMAGYSTSRAIVYGIGGNEKAHVGVWDSRTADVWPLSNNRHVLVAVATKQQPTTRLRFTDISSGATSFEITWPLLDRSARLTVTPDERFCLLAHTVDERSVLDVIRLPQCHDYSGWQDEEAPDRRAAAWLLSRSMPVGIRVGDEERQLHVWESLPDEPFRVTRVAYKGPLPPEGQEALAALDDLEVLDVSFNNHWREDDLIACTRSTGLRVLALPSCTTDATLDRLGHLDKLETIQLANAPITNAGLERLTSLKTLKHVLLGHRDGPSVDSLQLLNKLPQLRTLAVNPDRFLTEEGVAHLAQLSHLKSLRFHRPVTEQQLELLPPLRQLVEIRFTGSGLSVEQLESLAAKMPNCHVWDMTHPTIHNGLDAMQWIWESGGSLRIESGHGVPYTIHQSADFDLQRDVVVDIDLSDLPGLEVAALDRLEAFPGLETLNLAGTRLTDADLHLLERLIHLRKLHLDRTAVTADGIATLRKHLGRCEITGDGFAPPDVAGPTAPAETIAQPDHAQRTPLPQGGNSSERRGEKGPDDTSELPPSMGEL